MEKKKCVIVGFGRHARGSWFKSIQKHPDWELTAIVDTDTELLANIEQITNGIVPEDQAYIKIEELKIYGDLPDLAIVATPIPTHHVIVKDCMDLGLNVICEKNMASTIYQGRQMVQLAIDNPHLSTALGTQRRYMINSWTLKQYLNSDQNELGKLNFIQWNDAFNWGLYREGWRRFLPELYAEDQMIHWFDLLRWITEMDIVQVYADCFIPRGIDWQGSSTVIANLALAKPDDYHHRHNWVWVRFYGDWQRRGPRDDHTELREFCGTKGKLKINGPWLETWLYKNAEGTKWEEDGVMPNSNICNLNTNYEGQLIILEQMKRSIDSNGKNQPDNNFKDVFKSFAAVMGAIESSRRGRAIFVPDYWKDMNLH
ncbi:MAG: Gfo/Idh/MocA family protein [Promethearchaeota archaeon]